MEKIPYYKSLEFLELEKKEDDDLDYFETRNAQGFIQHHCFSPFFYVNSGLPLIEFMIFYNEEKNISICELWDHTGSIFCFATKNENEKFQLMKEYLCIAKDLSIFEKNLKEMKKEDE